MSNTAGSECSLVSLDGPNSKDSAAALQQPGATLRWFAVVCAEGVCGCV